MTDELPTASWGRRAVALLVDWIACSLAVSLFLPVLVTETGGEANFAVLGVFVLETTTLTWLAGGSFGKLATGLRTVPADGTLRAFNPLRLLARQVLVVLVIPPLVFRPDGRGLHDVLVGTATVTADTFRAMAAGARP